MAVVVRPRRFGFVIIEGASRIIAYGVRYDPLGHGCVRMRMRAKAARLMHGYRPTSLVAQNSGLRRSAPVVWEICEEASLRSVEVVRSTANEVRKFFRKHGCSTKEQVSALLADWYEEIAWKLPPKRKIWRHEAYNMLMFEAVALAASYLATA